MMHDNSTNTAKSEAFRVEKKRCFLSYERRSRAFIESQF
jgi:hypothetical protein